MPLIAWTQGVPDISATGSDASVNKARKAYESKCDLNASGCLVTPMDAATSRKSLSMFAERRSVRDYGAACDGTTDDSAAVAAGAAALRGTGAALYVPSNCRIRMGGASQVWLKGVSLVSDANKEDGGVFGTIPLPIGLQGGTIIIDTTVASPFVVSNSWGLHGLIFYWPQQTEALAVARGSAPLVYPPLVSSHGTDPCQDGHFTRNQVENAYDIMDLTGCSTLGGAGHMQISNNQMFALRYYTRWRLMAGETFITDNQFSPAAWVSGIMGTTTGVLRSFAAQNAEAIRVEGDGNTSQASTVSVDGMRLTGNYAFLMHYGLHVVGGQYNIATWLGNSFDEVTTPVAVDSGGLILATTISGGTWVCQNYVIPTVAPCLTVSGGAPGTTLALSNVDIPQGLGTVVNFNDTGGANLSITGGRIANVGNHTLAGLFAGVQFNAPNGQLTIVGTLISAAPAAWANAQGVVVTAAKTSVMTGLTLGQWTVPMVNNTTVGAHVVTGSVSYGSLANASNLAIQGAGSVIQIGNKFDIGKAIASIYAPSGQTGLIQCGGVDANTGCTISTKGASNLVFFSNGNQVAIIGPSGISTGTISLSALQVCGTAKLAAGTLCKTANNVVQVTP